MTKIDDKTLDVWLDKYPVDLSEYRLQSLEARILDAIEEEEFSLIGPLSLGESVTTLSFVGLVTSVVVWFFVGAHQVENTTSLFASLSMYGGF